jgi:hypothetical protein
MKNFIRKLKFLKALFSPFKPFKLKWYAGEIALGTPYFYPRRWVKYSKKEIETTVNEQVNKLISAGKILEQDRKAWVTKLSGGYKNTKHAVPKIIGFDFITLGWKLKFDNYRYEWAPMLSFVFFKWQIAVVVIAPHDSHYWESWLYYENRTDKTKSKAERIQQCRDEAPQTWIQHHKEGETVIDYYELILRDKYLKH